MRQVGAVPVYAQKGTRFRVKNRAGNRVIAPWRVQAGNVAVARTALTPTG